LLNNEKKVTLIEYAQNFETEVGPPAKAFRLALGALIIKEKLGISDRETVEQIRENPYLQYFIGQSSYSNEAPFDPSLLVHFRQRISTELVNKVNREVVRRLREATRSDSEKDQEEESEPPKNQGKLIINATCAPANISYPTDLKLLNQARVHTEKIIDVLYFQLKQKIQLATQNLSPDSSQRLLRSCQKTTTFPETEKKSD
jgi:IS5 family transposase